jgi:hypothetical protein
MSCRHPKQKNDFSVKTSNVKRQTPNIKQAREKDVCSFPIFIVNIEGQ